MNNPNFKNNENNIIIYNTIRKLGLRPNHSGTIFIVRAVQLMRKYSDIVIINNVYVELSKASKKFTPSQIRVAIKYAIDNRNGKKSASTRTWLDDEYKKVETYISNRNRVSENVERKVRPNVGITVDAFLKNLAGTTIPQKANVASEMKYKVGMEVKHKKFGIGVIENIEPEGDDFKLEIMFDNSGFKRLMANYTPLEIINKD